jgi:hypothetical protein
MPKRFHELRERLLRAGVAPRHVRRYLGELADHLADLRAEEMQSGHSAADAESAAFARLGSMDDLAKAMIDQRKFQSWCARAPWAMFSVAPALILAGAWGIALFILWSGWNIFLPGAASPFDAGHFKMFDFANIYFQLGRSIYLGAPILIGWGIGLIAIRQRIKATWPLIGLALIALMGDSLGVYCYRGPGNVAHVTMGLGVDWIVQGIPYGLLHTLVLLSTTAVPYWIWRLHQAYLRSA